MDLNKLEEKTRSTRMFFFIVLTSISLLGLVVIQGLWINNGIKVNRLFYDHRTNLALLNIDEELGLEARWVNDSVFYSSYQYPEKEFVKTVTFGRIDSLLHKYLDFYQLSKKYQFRVVKSTGDSTLFMSPGWNPQNDRIIYKSCLSCTLGIEQYHIELYFEERIGLLTLNVSWWILLSVLFIVMFIIGYARMISIFFSQKKINEIKRDFVNNTTHEFKTPIATISLASEVLLRSNRDFPHEKMVEYARIIYNENLRMRKQVDQVLRVAIMERGELKLDRKAVDIHPLIRNAVHNLLLDQSNKKVSIDYKLNAAQSIVEGDTLHLTNIVSNLIDNAVKYSGDNPKIIISTENQNDGIIVSVSDNGIGIKSADFEHIFDKFYRVHTGEVHNVKGHGLGLYYVKKVIESMGGNVTVSSEPGKGSTFRFFVPLWFETS